MDDDRGGSQPAILASAPASVSSLAISRRVHRRQPPVQVGLEEPGRGHRVQLLLPPFAGQPLAGPLAVVELLLGGEAAEPFVDEDQLDGRRQRWRLKPPPRWPTSRPARAAGPAVPSMFSGRPTTRRRTSSQRITTSDWRNRLGRVGHRQHVQWRGPGTALVGLRASPIRRAPRSTARVRIGDG